ncbi:MAG TPA: response regulator [Opitutaceae bacterium]|jgi:DNA-binding response OmpR family regulator
MKRILLIDDDHSICAVLKALLEDQGREVSVAENGKKGLAAFKTGPFDLIITDLVMPEKEGLETIREIRELSQTVPIIAISGGGRSDSRTSLRMAKIFGAAVALAKPFSLLDFSRAVDGLIGAPPPKQAHA